MFGDGMERWGVVVCGKCWSGFAQFLNLTAEWRSALWCAAEQDSVTVWWILAHCDRHAVTDAAVGATQELLRSHPEVTQKLPRLCGPENQEQELHRGYSNNLFVALPETQIVDSKRLGSWKLIGCLLFFSLQLFLTRSDVWVVNPNGHFTCCPGGHLFSICKTRC